MPDTTIPFDTMSNQSAGADGETLLNASQMRELWSAYEAARDGYDEKDEEQTGAIYTDAVERIFSARTADPEGIAIKLKVMQAGDFSTSAVIPNIIQDLTLPRPAPSLVDFCRAISAAAAPHTEEGGGIKSNLGLADALIPLIGHYSIAEATCTIALLHAAFQALGGEDGDDPMFAALMLLEDFVSRAEAADADSVAARAYVIERSAAGDDGWDLGPENMAAATRHAAIEARAMRSGRIPKARRGTFEAFATSTIWRSDADKRLATEAAAD